MKKYVKCSSTDLSKEKVIGLECIDALRRIYPDISTNPKFRRSKAWSDRPYITFDLGIDVEEAALQYQKSTHPSDWNLYWDYIHDFEDTCNTICNQPEFSNNFVECSVEYTDVSNTLHTSNAVLVVFALTK